MANLNKVFIIGNLTRDPELRYTPGGTAVANLRIATNRRYKDRQGEAKQEVAFLTVVTWDKQAEVCNQYLHKGSPLFVEGRLQSRSWDGPDGKKRNVVEIRAERIQFLGAPSGKHETAPESSPIPPEDKGVEAGISPEATDDVSWGQDVPEEMS
jgi:single-strand DNA-binding protein